MSNIQNENDYLELTKQLKESYELYEKKNKDLEDEIDELKKSLMTIYGLIHTLDD